MKISGDAVLHAPVDRVWAALNDPAVLVRTIPGCERLEATGPDAYKMTVTAGVASVRGTYAGEVRLSDKEEPSAFRMKASGAGGPGTVSTEVQVRLAESDGATRLTYDADAVVGGVVAGVGQRMLSSVAKKMAGEFFSAVDDVLTGRAAVAEVPAAEMPGMAAAGAAGPAAGEPGVFVKPAMPARALAGRWFMDGVLVGAGVALAGVVVGALIGRRRPR